LTGKIMTEAEFEIYNYTFNKAEAGWNIKSWIRDQDKIIAEYKKEHGI